MSERLLRNISIIYLALPNFLFYSYWVNIPIAIVGSFTLLYLIVRDRLGRDYSLMTVLRGKDFILIPGFSLILTVVSGICGLTFQNIDYWAHNVKFYELMSYSWPLRFDGAVISYYFGYYAVPGLIFKMTGEINEVVIFVWTWFGLGLGIAWIYLVLNKKLVLVWIALCIGDFPRVVKALLSFFSIRLYEPEEFGIETWSNFENLLWVPNQLIPTLLIGGMLGYGLKNRLKIDLMVLPVALSFWWAVFPAFTGGLLVGLLVMINWFLFPRKQDIMQIFDRVVLPFLVCLPVLVFFLSHMASPESGFVWLFRADKINLAVEYLVNIGINATVFLSLYLLYKRAKLPILNPTPAYFIFFLLITLPFYRMGEVNDLLFRGMMTPLILIGLYLLHPISAQTIRENIIMMKKSPVTMILTILLFSSVFMSIGRLCRAIIHNPVIAETTFSKQPYHAIPYDLYDNVYEVLQVKWSQKGADQYHGNQESFYEKYMAPQ